MDGLLSVIGSKRDARTVRRNSWRRRVPAGRERQVLQRCSCRSDNTISVPCRDAPAKPVR